MHRTFTVALEVNDALDSIRVDEVKRRIIDSLCWLGFVVGVDVDDAGEAPIGNPVDSVSTADTRTDTRSTPTFTYRRAGYTETP